MIVKKRKKTWLNKDLTSYEDIVKINLNKDDFFEFDLPSHYVDVFSQSSFPELQGGSRITKGKVLFTTMVAFDGCFNLVERHFRNEVIKLTEEKVLVVFLEGYADCGVMDNVFRMTWGSSHNLHTFINFKFERGMRVGSVIYKIEDERFRGTANGWEKLNNTFSTTQHNQRNSKDTQIVIPYTEEREAFLKAFKQELSNMIKKVDDFMDVFDNPRTLALIDNGGVSNLLTAPTPRIEDAEIIETKE